MKTSYGSLQLLTPTDCVKDRFASYFHWNDAQAFEQALLVAESYQIDLDNVKHWAKVDGYFEVIWVYDVVLEIF